MENMETGLQWPNKIESYDKILLACNSNVSKVQSLNVSLSRSSNWRVQYKIIF